MFANALNRLFVRTLVPLRREEGQTFVEYSMIGVLVAVGLVLALGAFKTGIATKLTNIIGSF